VAKKRIFAQKNVHMHNRKVIIRKIMRADKQKMRLDRTSGILIIKMKYEGYLVFFINILSEMRKFPGKAVGYQRPAIS
jgi:hypothetical protein